MRQTILLAFLAVILTGCSSKPAEKTEKPVEPAVNAEAAAEATAVPVAAKEESAVKTAAKPVIDKAAAEKIMKGSDCMACHQEKNKIVGPSWLQIAEKYRGQEVVAQMVKKVKDGSSGTWGSMPMNPHPNLPDKDVETAVRYILSVK